MVILENARPLGGAKQNFFHLIGYANAEYVLFADQDDVWYPAKAEETLAHAGNGRNAREG
jgi:rhamnosyltransferase